jgi:putative hydrolase of the HAD superfamily
MNAGPKNAGGIAALLVDIGGVLLTNGWDHASRALAAKTFALSPEEFEGRHRLVFPLHEVGKFTLDEYLSQTVFYEKRRFTREQFREFMFAQSRPYPEMIALVRRLKARYGVKVAVVSNEGRELTLHRIRRFKLGEFVDFFVSSCFVHLRKPDPDLYKLALDLAQTPARRTAYIENTALFVEAAEACGMRGILHTAYQSTRHQLAALGLGLAGYEGTALPRSA